MLDHRVYRAAFVPALVALFVVAFSLADPAAQYTVTECPRAASPWARSLTTDWAPPIWAGPRGVTGDETIAMHSRREPIALV